MRARRVWFWSKRWRRTPARNRGSYVTTGAARGFDRRLAAIPRLRKGALTKRPATPVSSSRMASIPGAPSGHPRSAGSLQYPRMGKPRRRTGTASRTWPGSPCGYTSAAPRSASAPSTSSECSMSMYSRSGRPRPRSISTRPLPQWGAGSMSAGERESRATRRCWLAYRDRPRARATGACRRIATESKADHSRWWIQHAQVIDARPRRKLPVCH